MTKITTPLGEIEIDPQPIEFEISDSEIGTKLKVKFEGIRSMTESGEFANIVWTVSQFDLEGKRMNPLFAVQDRQVVTEVSGRNRVTNEGITIIRESFPEGEAGDRAYQTAWNAGHNEYYYWMALLKVGTLPKILKAAGQILSQYNRFHQP